MISRTSLKAIIYLFVILLSLIALWLVNISPSYFIDNSVVYQGF